MPPILDGTASTYGEPEGVSLYLAIPYPVRVGVLLVVLAAVCVWGWV